MRKHYLTVAAVLLCMLAGCSKSADATTETAASDRHVTVPVQAAEKAGLPGTVPLRMRFWNLWLRRPAR